jgi:integrase
VQSIDTSLVVTALRAIWHATPETASRLRGRIERILDYARVSFPGASREAAISNMAMLQLLKRMGRSDLTVHGFRSTFRDWVAEQTPFPSFVAEAALAHAVAGKVEAAYRRGELMQKRRKLMEAWASYCYRAGSGEAVNWKRAG